MDQKTISWVSYITPVGWIIALVSYNSSTDKSSLARLHLRQTFGLFVTAISLNILSAMMFFVISLFSFIFWLAGIALFVLWLLGLIAAVNGEEKPVPVLGEFYQKTFTFIR